MPAAQSAEQLAARLRSEALRLIEASGLVAVLEGRFGSCTLAGSVDLNLMAWRDIDLSVRVERGEVERFVAVGPALRSALREAGYIPFRMVFNDEWHKPRGSYGSGYYWGFRVSDPDQEVWKIDCWGWDSTAYAAKLQQHEELKSALAAADRQLILKLKHEAMRHAGFRDSITSYDVYRLVLGGGRRLSDLSALT